MDKTLENLVSGYQSFRDKYTGCDQSIMKSLSYNGQQPKVMVVACCDSRVDPALILQCDPGDLFVVRNVASIVPPYEKDGGYHGTSAALEFGIRFLHVEHLILLGHSQCGGISALLEQGKGQSTDFIHQWVELVKQDADDVAVNIDKYTQQTLHHSYQNCMCFPWIKEKVDANELQVHLWFFEIKSGELLTYSETNNDFLPLLEVAKASNSAC